jgi:hypothetical protein
LSFGSVTDSQGGDEVSDSCVKIRDKLSQERRMLFRQKTVIIPSNTQDQEIQSGNFAK